MASVQQMKLGVRLGVCCYRDSRIAFRGANAWDPPCVTANENMIAMLDNGKRTAYEPRPRRDSFSAARRFGSMAVLSVVQSIRCSNRKLPPDLLAPTSGRARKACSLRLVCAPLKVVASALRAPSRRLTSRPPRVIQAIRYH